jgi:hypothetical protein
MGRVNQLLPHCPRYIAWGQTVEKTYEQRHSWVGLSVERKAEAKKIVATNQRSGM